MPIVHTIEYLDLSAIKPDPKNPRTHSNKQIQQMSTSRMARSSVGTSGFSQQYIADLERGRRNPTVVTLYELAVALNSTPVELLQP